MPETGQLYTLATWTVKAGKEAEFIVAWQAFADWTTGNMPGAGAGQLLQNQADTRRFVSFGPWQEQSQIDYWREQAEFQSFAATARDLCQQFEPRNMIVVASSAQALDS